MKIVQLRKYKNQDWQSLTPFVKLQKPLVMVFGDRLELEDPKIYKSILKLFPKGHIVFSSTGGNIISNSVDDECITITAIEFERSSFVVQTINLNDTELDSYKAGIQLVNKLPKDGLKYIMVFSDGSFINGSELTKGMNFAVNSNVLITGGLSADSDRFERTIVSYNENPKDGEIVAVGFYGDTLEVSSSIEGGWQPFGAERTVTRSKANILYELDKKPALDLFKKYLGDKADELPVSTMFYPLEVKIDEDQSIVRTVLNINEDYNAMIFAGDVPLNSKVQLMMTNVDDLVNSAQLTAQQAFEKLINKPQLAIVNSGLGRKLLLDQRTVEEIEQIKTVIGNEIVITGFYSNGEIAPFEDENMCQIHNQTIALTLISE
ncbi:FIST C-terminal domain-containing protein [Seonamhaeicola sp. MEBiC1930]|uniref:FIST signal transduction protein n=1 Tax=Seonamhaeicola sp. MEBiC01930 TaxID=2976768 RepID=UPI00324AD40F